MGFAFSYPDDLSGIKPGYTLDKEDNQVTFKVFSSVARQLTLQVFKSYDEHVQTIPLRKYDNHFWGVTILNSLDDHLYGYRLYPAEKHAHRIPVSEEPIADPYSTHIVWKHDFMQRPLTKIVHKSEWFDWQGTDYVQLDDPRDLVIYETHLCDQTGHNSSQSAHPKSYLGFVDPQARGGLQHLKNLGVNAVELLPLQKFSVYEPPYMQTSPDGSMNTWNFYGRNYWGYMTSLYFSPESFYSSDVEQQRKVVNDSSKQAHRELKTLVRECHKENISVIIDVVYNHVSNYDLNPLRYLDPISYFRWQNGGMESNSGCGNDLKTEFPVSRQLIVDSLCYWIEEFKIDGFRFDLAALLDWETIDSIKDALKKRFPHVLLISEPWFYGGYTPTEFADKGWSAWNDRFRNGVKGIEPHAQTGYIFGNTNGLASKSSVHNYLCGTLTYKMNGLFPSSRYSVNYIESHDGYTFGDFIRLTLNPDYFNKPVDDPDTFPILSPEELKYHKLGAVLLMLSQGTPMLHAGQEWGRSKIIAEDDISDPKVGYLDHDSYNKDNETNYLNFDFADKNEELVQFYRDLITLRKEHPSFRKLDASHIKLWQNQDDRHLTVTYEPHSTISENEYILSLNVDEHDKEIDVGENTYHLIINGKNVNLKSPELFSGKITVKAHEVILLMKLHD